jgi:hypothetical protein
VWTTGSRCGYGSITDPARPKRLCQRHHRGGGAGVARRRGRQFIGAVTTAVTVSAGGCGTASVDLGECFCWKHPPGRRVFPTRPTITGRNTGEARCTTRTAPDAGGYQGGTWTPPSHCTREPVAAGLAFYAAARRQSVRLAFACPDHVDDLIAPRPLCERDRAEMGRRHQREPVAELAVGREARELVERARRWAAAHPERTYRPDR